MILDCFGKYATWLSARQTSVQPLRESRHLIQEFARDLQKSTTTLGPLHRPSKARPLFRHVRKLRSASLSARGANGRYRRLLRPQRRNLTGRSPPLAKGTT